MVQGTYSRPAIALLALLVSFLAGISGCGNSGKTSVTGEVKVNGQPFKPQPPKEQMSLSYVPEDAPSKSYPAAIDSDGKFKVDDGTGQGIPPGKYKLVVQLGNAGPGGFTDRFGNAYSAQKTTLRHEVSASNSTIKLDLIAK